MLRASCVEKVPNARISRVLIAPPAANDESEYGEHDKASPARRVIFIVGMAPGAPDMITIISVSCASMPHARQIYDVDAPFRQLRTVSLHLFPVAIST